MIQYSGTIWRIVFQGFDPLQPVTSPEGRFHHSGQSALYASLTPEGCAVAIRRYVGPSDPPREIVPLTVALNRVEDIRGKAEASVVWQDQREGGQPAPTWAFSDAARAKGAQALLYSSRSRPELSHIVLLNDPSRLITASGAAQPWPGPSGFPYAT